MDFCLKEKRENDFCPFSDFDNLLLTFLSDKSQFYSTVMYYICDNYFELKVMFYFGINNFSRIHLNVNINPSYRYSYFRYYCLKLKLYIYFSDVFLCWTNQSRPIKSDNAHDDSLFLSFFCNIISACWNKLIKQFF